MRTLLEAVRNRFLIGYIFAYAAALWYMGRQPGFEAGEIIATLVIAGVLLSSLALLFTRKAETLPIAVRAPGRELAAVLVYMVPLAVFLVWGMDALRSSVTSEPGQSLTIAAAKLLAFVVLPAALLMRGWGYRMGELTPVGLGWKQMRPALWMSGATLLMQAVLGRGLHDLRQAQLPAWLAAAAAPLCLLWLALEVGLVEEFFFRALLQTRLARLTGSELSGVIAASAVFGLVHVPGLYLRTAATGEGLASSPSLLGALAYSILFTSVAGFFLGTLWARTRNTAVVVLVHAAADLIPNLLPFLKTWQLY